MPYGSAIWLCHMGRPYIYIYRKALWIWHTSRPNACGELGVGVYIDFDDGRFPPCDRGGSHRRVQIASGVILAQRGRLRAPNLPPTWPILGPSWRQHGLQEASKWSPKGGPDRIWGHLSAKRAPKGQLPKTVIIFRQNVQKSL